MIMAPAPEDATMTTISLLVGAQGHVRCIHTPPLMSPEAFMSAQQKAHGMTYAAPTKG